MYIKEEDFVIVKYSNLDGFLGILAGFFFTTTHALYIYMCHWNKVHNHLFAGIRLLWHLQTFWWIHKLGACSKSLPSKISIYVQKLLFGIWKKVFILYYDRSFPDLSPTWIICLIHWNCTCLYMLKCHVMCWQLTKQIQAYKLWKLWELTSEIISITDWLTITIE